jgi:hypothetical protein
MNRMSMRASISMAIAFFCAVLVSCSSSGSGADGGPGRLITVAPRASASPAPLCGIVLWGSNGDIEEYSSAVRLEFSYFYYSDVASDDGAGGYAYDWTAVDSFLAAARGRGHHGIVRFRDTDPELGTTGRSLPASLWVGTRQADYDEGIEGAARKRVVFPDWTNADIPAFIIEFYQRLAARYPDQSTGLAYVEVGFGLWAEYHIDYDNLSNFSSADADTAAEALGRLFPSRADQIAILTEIGRSLVNVPWGISVDAANEDFGPYPDGLPASVPPFGLFDDSLLQESWDSENRENWDAFARVVPATCNGGEFSYYTSYDQQHALDQNGPHGLSLAAAARRCALSFVIGDGQTDYQTPAAVASAGRSLGYALEVEEVRVLDGITSVRVRNVGSAPVTYPIFASFEDLSSAESLRGLLPNQARTLTVATGDPDPASFSFTSPVLLPGQVIPYTVQ